MMIQKDFDTFPLNFRTPQFCQRFIKSLDENLPLGYPSWPIESAFDSHTDQI